MMKPLVRWTIGDKTDVYSYECLRRSIYFLRKLYGDSLDYVVCQNGSSRTPINVGVPVVKQEPHITSISVLPYSVCWKLYPPRLRIKSHEIFIDNDVVFLQRIPSIDRFLAGSKHFFASEAVRRNYGNYDDCVLSNININSGFFGLPPGFDFAGEIETHLKGKWSNYFDDQGMVATILHKQKDFELVSLADLWVCATELRPAKYGYHFVGLNGGLNEHYENFINQRFYGKLI
jgi:hypothetical protein